MNAEQKILFDEALPKLVDVVVELFGSPIAEQGVFLRDNTGRLAFVSNLESDERRESFTKIMRERLGSYARLDYPLVFKSDPGASALLSDTMRLPFRMGNLNCQLIDRRIVGAGWLSAPIERADGPTRVVFASVKGGVGRSSALAVVAADFAKRGKNVLAIDLDIEAPGLGDLLLTSDRMPQLGTVDYLVENGIGGVSDLLLEEFVGISFLTSGSGGRVDVVPAFGTSSRSNAGNILPKLARAMIEDISDDGKLVPLTEQISDMIGRLSRLRDYDVILIDSRAGLAEISAASFVSLGAIVLLFGTVQLQTTTVYRALLAALGQLAKRDKEMGLPADWRMRIKSVVAKATLREDVLAQHRDTLYDLFAEELYDEDLGDIDDLNFSMDDSDAPHWPLVVPFNATFSDFDPLRDPGHLTAAFYEQTFRPFLDGLNAILTSIDRPGQQR